MRQIQDCHGGSLIDSRFGVRSRGEGKITEQIHAMLALAKRKYFKDSDYPKLDNSMHEAYKDGQMRLF